MSSTPQPSAAAATAALPTPIVASPTLLSRIETLIATVETKIKSEAGTLGSVAADIPKVEAAATKYWMAIAGILVGMVADHLLKFL